MTNLTMMDSNVSRKMLLEGLTYLYEQQYLCDCAVISSDGSIKCHRAVLAACSKYLRTIILENNRKETIIECAAYDHANLKEVITYIYTGKCTITSGNACELLRISFQWHLEYLYRECVAFAQCQLNERNATKYHQVACEHQNYQFKEVTSRFIRDRFLKVYNFNRLSMSNFRTLLQYNEIRSHEDEVCTKVVEWINYNPTDDDYTGLLQIIRFDHLTNQSLHDVKHHPLMQHEAVQELITLAISYQDNGERHGCMKEARYWKPRVGDTLPEYIPNIDESKTSTHQQTTGISI